jgi:hypothetical protein
MDNIQFIPFTVGVGSGSPAHAEARASEALGKIRDTKDDLADLRADVDRLQMICEAMWTIVKLRTGAAEEELAKLVEEIDLRDGKVDGKSVKPPMACKMCGRAVSVRTSVCLYCGAHHTRPTVF